MRNLQKVGIFGLGKTGTCSYQALNKTAKLICYDDNVTTRELFINKFESKNIVELLDPQWRGLDKILVSPGVPKSHKIFKIARDNNIKITSDVEILFENNRKANFISITGTNGKSTTTALIGHILNNSYYDYSIGGNIGIAPLCLPLDKEGYILELSSFQIDLLSNFKTKIAVLLNITQDHIDRHRTIEEYIKIKESLLYMLASDGIGIIGIDNEITNCIYQNLKNNLKLIPISFANKNIEGISYLKGEIFDNFFEKVRIPVGEPKYLQGEHNRENMAASFAVCKALGLKWEQIISACSTFQGLPHRMQYLGSIKTVNFYNDSKATNADSASKSIGSLDNIYWLVGGIAKEGGINSLKPLFSRIRKAYLFGRDRNVFANSLRGLAEYKIYDNLEDSFKDAFEDAIHDNNMSNILLAPAASSYDQFDNFEHRGEVFIKLYKNKIMQ